MEYMGDKEYWDKKFMGREDKPLDPEPALVDNLSYFKKGSVLDIACGDGRNALFFLENGFSVTGVDFSAKALARLELFAKRSDYLVNTKQIDLSKENPLKDLGIFDNIVINHYRLSKECLLKIHRHVTDQGILFICGFGHKHKTDDRIKQNDLIQPFDFDGMDSSLKRISYVESQDHRGFMVTYIFRKEYGGQHAQI